jgi:hypothetical protein
MIEAAPPASIAGIITASASVFTALGLLVTAIVGAAKVFLPILKQTRRNTAQLAIIHTLVNSTLTAAMQSELDANRREELLMRELVRMRTESGKEPSDDQLAALGATHRKIEELTRAMADRMDQTRAADIQIETEAQRRSNGG